MSCLFNDSFIVQCALTANTCLPCIATAEASVISYLICIENEQTKVKIKIKVNKKKTNKIIKNGKITKNKTMFLNSNK